MHFPHSQNYIRRIRLASDSELLEPIAKAGYKMEDDCMSKDGTKVVEIPVTFGSRTVTLKDWGIKLQFELAATLQKYWADNQVSCTVTFDPESEGHLIPELLDQYQHQLKGISLLPNLSEGAYP